MNSSFNADSRPSIADTDVAPGLITVLDLDDNADHQQTNGNKTI